MSQTAPDSPAFTELPIVDLARWRGSDTERRSLAAEVADAPRTFPRALWGALGLTTALYVLPLAACAAASPDTREWREGQFALLGERFGGGALEGAITAAVVVSMPSIPSRKIMIRVLKFIVVKVNS